MVEGFIGCPWCAFARLKERAEASEAALKAWREPNGHPIASAETWRLAFVEADKRAEAAERERDAEVERRMEAQRQTKREWEQVEEQRKRAEEAERALADEKAKGDAACLGWSEELAAAEGRAVAAEACILARDHTIAVLRARSEAAESALSERTRRVEALRAKLDAWAEYATLLHNRADDARAAGDADHAEGSYRTAANNVRMVADDLRAALSSSPEGKAREPICPKCSGNARVRGGPAGFAECIWCGVVFPWWPAATPDPTTPTKED
jgi:membrane protein involved in colicin uptake